MNFRHSIHLAAQRAGLTVHLVRAWEKRYDAVSPDRTDTNRRLYSDDEIERLRLLGILTRAGHRIGDIARLPTTLLRAKAVESEPREPESSRTFTERGAIGESMSAVQTMKADALVSVLERCSIALGQRGLSERVIGPLVRQIGEAWANGSMTAAHEHFASSILRTFLLNGTRAFAESAHAPIVVVTTPAGQLHELGAAIAATAASDLGWRVRYLGPNLPAADIANAATILGAKVVALSLVYPNDDPALAGELVLLRKLLPKETLLIAGGAAASAYLTSDIGAGTLVIDDINEFARQLLELRRPPGHQ